MRKWPAVIDSLLDDEEIQLFTNLSKNGMTGTKNSKKR